tara:strand:- start:79059 stop:79535 length:477 start_codon:yes stop_codon:yes gene_type:complete
MKLTRRTQVEDCRFRKATSSRPSHQDNGNILVTYSDNTTLDVSVHTPLRLDSPNSIIFLLRGEYGEAIAVPPKDIWGVDLFWTSGTYTQQDITDHFNLAYRHIERSMTLGLRLDNAARLCSAISDVKNIAISRLEQQAFTPIETRPDLQYPTALYDFS